MIGLSLIDDNKMVYSNAEITMVPKTTVHLEGKQAQQTLNLIDSLEELDDVQEVFSNFEISDVTRVVGVVTPDVISGKNSLRN